MRVVAGSARGRTLLAPPGTAVRPTSDRARESIFNSLGSLGLIEGARVLDLFCGTGALGIEALSRGAAEAVFVDHHAASLAATRANVAACGFEDRSSIVRGDALKYLTDAAAGVAGGAVADLVLLDPPYVFDEWARLLALVTDATVVIESDREIDPGAHWEVRRRRRHGDTVVTIASWTGAPDAPDPQEFAK